MVGALATGPLEMIKTRLQAERNKQEIRDSGKRHMFGTRIGYALRHVYATSGITGLWRGIGPHLAGTIPARAIHFGVYNEAKKRYKVLLGKEGWLQHLLAAASAGLCSVTITSPLWVIKTRMQLQTPQEMRYRNSVDCLIQMVRYEGWRSLFRGLSASIVGISESSMQFVMYEKLKKVLAKPDVELTVIEYMTAASAAKMAAVAITYPHEVVRTRMREVTAPGAERRYKTLLQSFGRVWAEEGVVGMYGGMAAHMVRVVPNAGIMFLTYELFVRFFARQEKQD